MGLSANGLVTVTRLNSTSPDGTTEFVWLFVDKGRIRASVRSSFLAAQRVVQTARLHTSLRSYDRDLLEEAAEDAMSIDVSHAQYLAFANEKECLVVGQYDA